MVLNNNYQEPVGINEHTYVTDDQEPKLMLTNTKVPDHDTGYENNLNDNVYI